MARAFARVFLLGEGSGSGRFPGGAGGDSVSGQGVYVEKITNEKAVFKRLFVIFPKLSPKIEKV